MNLQHHMRDTVTVKTRTALDATGKPTFGDKRTVKARVEKQRRLVRTAAGDDKQATHRLYLAEALELGDRVWLPGADTTKLEASLPVLAVVSATALGSRWTLYEVDV